MKKQNWKVFPVETAPSKQLGSIAEKAKPGNIFSLKTNFAALFDPNYNEQRRIDMLLKTYDPHPEVLLRIAKQNNSLENARVMMYHHGDIFVVNSCSFLFLGKGKFLNFHLYDRKVYLKKVYCLFTLIDESGKLIDCNQVFNAFCFEDNTDFQLLEKSLKDDKDLKLNIKENESYFHNIWDVIYEG